MNSIKEIQEAIIKNKQGNIEPVYVSTKMSIRPAEDQKVKTFIMSNEVRDRDGDVMKMSGAEIEHYNNNPVVLWMHESRRGPYDASYYNPDLVIGKGRAYVEGNEILNDIEFEPADINPLADKISKKIDFGSLSRGSIGFYPKEAHWGEKTKGEDPDTFYITKWELLEYSIVVIPANPGAGRKEAHTISDTDIKNIGAAGITSDQARARLSILINTTQNTTQL